MRNKILRNNILKPAKTIEADFLNIGLLPHEQLCDVEFDKIEEYFFDYFDLTTNHNQFDFDTFEKYIQVQNFFPHLVGKDVGSGSWVKVKSDIGYNVYWAKKSNKRISVELLQRKLTGITKINKNDSSDVLKDKLEVIKTIKKEIDLFSYLLTLPFEMQFVKILKGKNNFDYILPSDFDMVEDVTIYTDAIMDGMNGGAVKAKEHFTSADEDKVFYLQSRGISREIAVMMVKLQHCHFIIDSQKLFANWMQPVKK
jgi:hypothetical protein